MVAKIKLLQAFDARRSDLMACLAMTQCAASVIVLLGLATVKRESLADPYYECETIHAIYHFWRVLQAGFRIKTE